MEWYYAKFGKQEGPVPEETLRSKVESGEISPTDLVWRQGLEKWEPAGSVAELRLAGAGPPPPPAASAPMTPGRPGSGMPASYAPAPTSGAAVVSMVFGILGMLLIFCGITIVCALPAVICGHVALKQIRDCPVPLGGRGMAVSGLVMGYLGLFLQAAFVAIAMFGVLAA